MFKLKGKPTLQEIERTFSIEMGHLGSYEFQLERLRKAKAQSIQKLENLSKQAQETKKKIESEINQTAGLKDAVN